MKRTLAVLPLVALLFPLAADAQTRYSVQPFPSGFSCPVPLPADGLGRNLYKSTLSSTTPGVAAGSDAAGAVAQTATTSQTTGFGAPAGLQAAASGLNVLGDLAAVCSGRPYARVEAAADKWRQVAPDLSGVPAQGATMAVNMLGVFCGYAEVALEPQQCDPNSSLPCTQYRAFRYIHEGGETFQALPLIYPLLDGCWCNTWCCATEGHACYEQAIASYAYGVNADGDIVGMETITLDPDTSCPIVNTTGVVWKSDAVTAELRGLPPTSPAGPWGNTTAYDINDHAVAVGYGTDASGAHVAMAWDTKWFEIDAQGNLYVPAQTLAMLPEAINANAIAINNAGQIVGYQWVDSSVVMVVWDYATGAVQGVAGGISTCYGVDLVPLDINEAGEILAVGDVARPNLPLTSGAWVISPTADPAPQLLAAYSRKVHGGVPWDVLLPQGGTAATEPRSSGVTEVRLQFSENIHAADGTPDANEASSNYGTVTTTEISGAWLTVRMTGSGDQRCVVIHVKGIADSAGNPYCGDIRLATLLGDVDGSGVVDITDQNLAKANVNKPLTAQNFRCDLDRGGSVALPDYTITKACLGHQATCP